jgi:hypothetical protein
MYDASGFTKRRGASKPSGTRQTRKDRADGSGLAGFRNSIKNGLDAIEVTT